MDAASSGRTDSVDPVGWFRTIAGCVSGFRAVFRWCFDRLRGLGASECLGRAIQGRRRANGKRGVGELVLKKKPSGKMCPRRIAAHVVERSIHLCAHHTTRTPCAVGACRSIDWAAFESIRGTGTRWSDVPVGVACRAGLRSNTARVQYIADRAQPTAAHDPRPAHDGHVQSHAGLIEPLAIHN